MKRKRNQDVPAIAQNAFSLPGNVGRTIGNKIHHSYTELRRIVKKKAVGFETQKLVRRLKHARSSLPALRLAAPEKAQDKEREVARWEADLEALKSLDVDRVSALAVDSIFKHDALEPHRKLLMSHVPFDLLPPEEDVAKQRLEARILQSAPVKQLMDDLSVYIVELVTHASQGKRLPTKSSLEKQRAKKQKIVPSNIVKPAASEPSSASDSNVVSESESSQVEEWESDAGSVQVLRDEETAKRPNSAKRLDKPLLLDKESIAELFKRTMDDASDQEMYSFSSNSHSEVDDLDADGNSDQADSRADAVISADELDRSDWSGSEESRQEVKPSKLQTKTDKKTKPEKEKNRMGQRARRMLAEKKYGTKAKHILDGGESMAATRGRGRGADSRGRGTDTRGRGTDARGRGRGMSASIHQRDNAARVRGRGMPLRGRGFPSGASRETPHEAAFKPKTEEAPLHPSWELKRQARRKEEDRIANTKFAGTRVVFDD